MHLDGLASTMRYSLPGNRLVMRSPWLLSPPMCTNNGLSLNKAGSIARIYGPAFTFAAGSHSYLDYGWSRPAPGPYSRFATRYGEFFWDKELAPVSPEKAGVSVEGGDQLCTPGDIASGREPCREGHGMVCTLRGSRLIDWPAADAGER